MSSDAFFALPSSNPNPNPKLPPKKKRNLPGTPDPEADVIALSPKSLMATNRFVCEICKKGFQRDQNLQLHRRGHNLPWKLRQRVPGVEIKKRVYICPEPSCVHHDPARALGDLTGIKKHFSRKHGEKKWKCERCSKKYAVRSDWKAHLKTCGTREYKCDCGAVFSRKDSFITHRAFCDALTHESAKLSLLSYASENNPDLSVSYPPPSATNFLSANSMTLPSEMAQIMPNAAVFPPPISTISNSEEWNNILSRNGSNAASPHLSATALLQKAAQMGASMSSPSSSLFSGLRMGSAQRREGEVFGNGVHGTNSAGAGASASASAGSGTRDFLGLGRDGPGQQQHFDQEMAKFGYMSSGLDLV